MEAGLLAGRGFVEQYGAELNAAASRAGLSLRPVLLPDDPDARLTSEDLGGVKIAFFSGDIFPDHSRALFSAVQQAEDLEWFHTFTAGTDHPVFQRLLARGVRMSNSAGSSAEPIAHSVIGGMLLLSRPFLHWMERQRERRWEGLARADAPADLRGQTLVVLGLGEIGKHVARVAGALGLHVIGVRRSAQRDDDPVDEMVTPTGLAEVLPRADWLVVTAPLTPETRGIVNADALARLPRGARVLNVGRGEIIDEQALIAALGAGQVGGAYLDVVETEPLPPESPLWDMPNVIISPHNSAISNGNEARSAAIFLENLERWATGAPLRNEVVAPG